jgi:hypothetical protein
LQRIEKDWQGVFSLLVLLIYGILVELKAVQVCHAISQAANHFGFWFIYGQERPQR